MYYISKAGLITQRHAYTELHYQKTKQNYTAKNQDGLKFSKPVAAQSL